MKALKPKPLASIAFLALAVALTIPTTFDDARAAQAGVPQFEPDPYWPKPLPNNWMLGQVSGIYVDSHDHIWVTSRPRTLDNNDKYARAQTAGSRLLHSRAADHEFDQAGNVIQGWGGPGPRLRMARQRARNVRRLQRQCLDRWQRRQGHQHPEVHENRQFLLQIGHHGKSGGSNDTENLKRPAGICVYQKTNEVFVADGYGNRRVIVFDADTGAYKRHWGAYGNKPDDNAPSAPDIFEGPGPQQFQYRRTAFAFRTTAWSTWAIASTTGFRCSGPTARS